MSLTIGSRPNEVITNEPEISVTTTLTEGASYQNLRIRATIYIGGETEAVAVLEQPKGLDDWDFFEVLRSFIGKCDTAVGGNDGFTAPTYGSELLSAWSESESNFSTFTTSGRVLTSCITSGGGGADYAKSNDLGSAAIGDVYIVMVPNGYTDSGSIPVQFVMSQTDDPINASDLNCLYSGLTANKNVEEHIYIFCMPYADTTPYIFLGSDVEGTNFGGMTEPMSIKKISNFRNNPGVYFTIKFEEVYENASDVTTIGGERYSQSYLFVPVVVPVGESFENDYLGNSHASGKYLVRSYLKAYTSATYIPYTKYKYGIGMEMRVMELSTVPYILLQTTPQPLSLVSFNCNNPGWFMSIFNDDTASVDDTLTFWSVVPYSCNEAFDFAYQGLHAINVYAEPKCYPDIKVINFVGDLGEETLMFTGLHSETGKVNKTFYRNVNRVRKVLKAYKYTRMKLRSLLESIPLYGTLSYTFSTRKILRELLYQLAYTEQDVWMYDEDEATGYKEVTVIDDDIQISDKNELVESAIDIEYYE
jgi:hypothetical protein